MSRQIRRCGKTQYPESEAILSLDGVPQALFQCRVLWRPRRSVCPPEKRIVRQNKSGPRKVTRRADNLRARPVLSSHNLPAVVNILDSVLSLPLLRNSVGWNALRHRKLLHHTSLDILIMSSTASHDQVRSNTGLVLADPFKRTLPLLRRGTPISIGGSAKNDQRIKVTQASIAGRYAPIHKSSTRNRDRTQRKQGNQKPPKSQHAKAPD
jgi:hypothetical protein